MYNVKISVVIPCYNCVETIEVCFDSAYNQSYPIYEIILVNDGSTDGTLIKLKELQSKYQTRHDTKIIIKNQENRGPSEARNNGIRVSTGDWIAFLDSDDMWHLDKVKTQVNVILLDDSIVSIGGGKGKLNEQLSSIKKFKVNFKQMRLKNYFLTSSTMVNRNSLKGLFFNVNQKHSEDYRFFWELLKDGKVGVILEDNLSNSILNKRDFGDSGLSGDLNKMEKGELSNFRYFYMKGKLSLFELVICYCFSILKYFRRVFISKFL
ncbi:glycosyltransferase family A protein [Myroides odoratimimus]|uniref:glycosyltransferase family 2 protein n=1 Tax=Myroides odoratimimus TaxID=76832 RepID=UPI003100D175